MLWDTIRSGAVLRVASEDHLCGAITRLKPREYVQGDTISGEPAGSADQRDCVSGPDEHFDMISCNHVLEQSPMTAGQ